MHNLLSTSFGFPVYYGANWDAFDECIRDVHVPPTISVVGIEALGRQMPREAELLVRCLEDFAAEHYGQVQVCVS